MPTDMMVAIDLSGSMNDDGGEPPQPISAVKTAAAAFVERTRELDTVGLVIYATEAVVALPLSSDRTGVQQAIKNLVIAPESETGSTNTGDALRLAGEELISERHNPDARKVLVLLTDGLATAPDEDPEGYAEAAASVVRQDGTEVYVIGLGENVNMDFVRRIATTPAYAYQALTRDDVDRIYQTITSAICEDGAAVIDILAKTDAGFIPLR
ncbi:MAG: VWA domain-containing protein [Candidatus Paceibacterota bacterium]